MKIFSKILSTLKYTWQCGCGAWNIEEHAFCANCFSPRQGWKRQTP